MNRNLNPVSILITGASSGLGAALALYYSAPGVTLFLSGRNQDGLTDTTQKCQARGARIVPNIIDVRDQVGMQNWIKACDRDTKLDLVIANAGISGGSGGDGESPAQADDIFATNVTGTLNTLHPALDCMGPRGSGQIAVISSLAGLSGWPGAPAYSASKGAGRLYAEALHGAWKKRGIHICAVCPGFIRTPMTDVNPFPMPFMISAEKAAQIIAAGLRKRKARVAFPGPTYLIAGFIGLLPAFISAKILANAPQKPPI